MRWVAVLLLCACGPSIDGEWSFTISAPEGAVASGKFELAWGDGKGKFKKVGDEERELDVRTTIEEPNVELRLSVKDMDNELTVNGLLSDQDPELEGPDKISGVVTDAKGAANQFVAHKIDPDAPQVRPLGEGL